MLALLGCSRPTVVMAPPDPSQADEPAVHKTAAREQADQPEEDPFAFPDDAGGVLLAKVLPPKAVETAWRQPTGPLRRSSVSTLMRPSALPLPPSHADLPRLPDEEKCAPLRPRFVLEETLGNLAKAPVLPQPSSLPAAARVHVPSLDVNQPPPLPMRTRPAPDRASLDDPTWEASTAAALAAPIPARAVKAPFLKLTLPDPYGRRRTGVPAAEEAKDFPLGSPQTPRR